MPKSTSFVKSPPVATIVLLLCVLFAGTSAAAEASDYWAQANSGLFLPFVVKPLEGESAGVAVGDVNDDGLQDVVVGTTTRDDPESKSRIHVFLQDSNGQLAPPVDYTVTASSRHPCSLRIGDLNNDGKNDVVVAGPDSIGILCQNDAGGLDPVVSYPSGHTSNVNVHRVRIGDFNGDGLLDVASVDNGTSSNDVDVFLQNTTGTLDPPIIYNVGYGNVGELGVADLNSDGLDDIVVLIEHAVEGQLGVLLQNAGGTFDAPVYYDGDASDDPESLAVGDVNGDGRDDVVTVRQNYWVYLQNESGTLDPPISYPTGGTQTPVIIGDVNDDGNNDVISAEARSLRVLLQDVDGTLLPNERYFIPNNAYYFHNYDAIGIGDINNGGANDIVLTKDELGLVILYNSSIRPRIAASEASLSNSCQQGRNAASQTFEVWNGGGETLSYAISDDAGWLTCNPAGGTSKFEHDAITVSYAASNLAPGNYSATITISDPGASNSPQHIPVSLDVTHDPEIGVSPYTISGSCRKGSNAPDQGFAVWNAGFQTLSYTISDDAAWLQCVPASGTSLGEADSITVQFDTSALDVGVYSAIITVSDPNAVNNSQQIGVAVTVTPGPLTSITLGAPAITSVLHAPPLFTWMPDGGTNNAFAVDLSLDYYFTGYWSTWNNLHLLNQENSWAMTNNLWNMVPTGTITYWRVRGMDLDAYPQNIVTSTDIWWFIKP